MPKSIRKIIVLLLAIVIVATATLTAFAQQEPSSDNSMETALIAVKSLLDIDDKVFTEFTYSSSYSNYETMEGLIWAFNWADANNSSIYAQAREDGTLMQFWKYTYNGKYFGFAEINKDAAVTIADEFIKRAKPNTYSYYKAPANVNASIHSSDYSINYYAEVNGYTFSAAYVSVNVDKFTGEVTGYNTSNVDLRNFRFESAGGIISEDTAVAAYAEKIGLSLEYRSYFNYENNTSAVFPVYLLSSGAAKYISAKTGEVIEYVYDSGTSLNDSATSASAAPMMEQAEDMSVGGSGGGSASLTPAEIDAIDKVSNYLTSEQALQKLLEAMDLEDLDVNSFSEKYIGLNRDYRNRDHYYYDINLYRFNDATAYQDDDIMYAYGRVEAESGKVMSFSYYYFGTPASGETSYTEEQAAASVDAFLKKMAPDEFAKTKIEEVAEGAAVPYNPRGEVNSSYIRYENGIPFRDNGINISFNLYTGKVTTYYLNWFDNVSFPGVSGVMAPQSALSAYVAQNGSNITYITTGGGNASLVYEFGSRAVYIDPFDGGALNYSGEPQAEDEIAPDYSDVAGHWSEDVVMRLLDNGVYKWGGPFEPNKVMTELEFLEYLLLLEPYYNYLEPRDFFTERGIDIAVDPDKIITRQEAARIIVEYLGYGKLAEQSEWFVYPFSDNVNEQYKGYITICFMLGIAGGDNGSFNAAGSITRAQAAVILQNLIILKT